MSRLLTDEEITRQLEALSGWSRVGDSIGCRYQAPTFTAGIEFVREVADAAEDMDHHPDITISYTTVGFSLSTHSEGGVTQLDVELAHRIAEAAAHAGVRTGA